MQRWFVISAVLTAQAGCAAPARIGASEAREIRAALARPPSTRTLIAARRSLIPTVDRGVARAAWKGPAPTEPPRDAVLDTLAALRAVPSPATGARDVLDLRPSHAPSDAEVSVDQFWDDTPVQGCGATVRVTRDEVVTAAALLLRAPGGAWRASAAEIEQVARAEATRRRPSEEAPSLRAERAIVVPGPALALPEARRSWIVRLAYPHQLPLVVIIDAETARIIRAFSTERRAS